MAAGRSDLRRARAAMQSRVNGNRPENFLGKKPLTLFEVREGRFD